LRGNLINGNTEDKRVGKGGKHKSFFGYILVWNSSHPRALNGYVREHLLIAEKAIDKYIPSPACIHHVNEIKDDNRQTNLVVCQDRNYHNLLHRRKRALLESGNANNRKCTLCHKYDKLKNLLKSDRCSFVHFECRKKHNRKYYLGEKRSKM